MSDIEEYSHSSNAGTRNKRSINKKRFSDGQVKSLESMFETDSRLEPAKKLELARELGLQPRQVAIWFQNKRARWKLKQVQRDYTTLRANYNTLDSRFDALNKEYQSMLTQVRTTCDTLLILYLRYTNISYIKFLTFKMGHVIIS